MKITQAVLDDLTAKAKYSKDDYRLTEAEYRKIVRRMEVFSNSMQLN